MDRFSNLRNYLTSVNRSVLLAIGLVIIAGLIAAVFIYGEADDNGRDTNGSQTAEEAEGNRSETEEELVVGEDNGEVAQGSDESEVLPSQLADTGPGTPLLASILIGGTIYFYRRSRKQMFGSKLNG